MIAEKVVFWHSWISLTLGDRRDAYHFLTRFYTPQSTHPRNFINPSCPSWHSCCIFHENLGQTDSVTCHTLTHALCLKMWNFLYFCGLTDFRKPNLFPLIPIYPSLEFIQPLTPLFRCSTLFGLFCASQYHQWFFYSFLLLCHWNHHRVEISVREISMSQNSISVLVWL